MPYIVLVMLEENVWVNPARVTWVGLDEWGKVVVRFVDQTHVTIQDRTIEQVTDDLTA